MKYKSLIENKSFHKTRMIVFVIFITTLLFISIGYAANLSSLLAVAGKANINATEGNLEITSISNVSSVNATSTDFNYYQSSNSTVEEMILVGEFDIDFYRTGGSSSTSISYQIEIKNDTFFTQTLENIVSNPTLSNGSTTNFSYKLSGISEGTTVLKPRESVTAMVTFSLANTSRNTHYTVNEILELHFKKNSSNTLQLAPILKTSSVTFENLTDTKEIKILLVNNDDTSIEYNISTSHSSFEVLDANQNPMSSFTIAGNTQEEISLYLKIANDHIFVQNSETVNLILNTTSPLILEYELGVITAYTADGGAKKIISDETIYDDISINFTTATTTSGIYKNTSSGEVTYFYRGNVTNNYVSFAGLTWRIIRIDKYGTRIILDDVISNTSVWASSNTATSLTNAISILTYKNSLVKQVVDDWYADSNLSSYGDIIKTSLFCEDFNYQSLTSSGSGYTTYYFGSYIRNGKDSDDYTPEFSCDEDYISYYNVGLISGDEVAFAGGLFNSNNTNYYLYNQSISSNWWTLSASYYDTSLTTVGMFIVDGSNGKLYDWQNGSTISNDNAIRPVITLDTDRISGGTGISSDPYTFS